MKRAIILLIVIGWMTPALAKAFEVSTRKTDRDRLEFVPVERFVTNLKKQLEATPDDATLHYKIGRLYAQAYAMARDEFAVERGKAEDLERNPELNPELDFIMNVRQRDPSLPPKRNWGADAIQRNTKTQQTTILDERKAEARRMLDLAMPYYKSAYRLAPEDHAIRLGLAWLLEQNQQTDEAIELYEKLLTDLLDEYDRTQANVPEKDKSLDIRIRLWKHRLMLAMIHECADNARSLLGETVIQDEEEWSMLLARVHDVPRAESLESPGVPSAISPIAIPFTATTNHDSLINSSARVKFNLDGLSDETEWTWITPEAGWLVWNPSGDGVIESGKELFGNVTFWVFWRNGYEALAALDDDQDGAIAGAEMDGLAIWRDANSNGISEPGEVQPVAAWGIRSLSTQWLNHDKAAAWNPEGVEFDSGEIRPTYDVLLEQRMDLTTQGARAKLSEPLPYWL